MKNLIYSFLAHRAFLAAVLLSLITIGGSLQAKMPVSLNNGGASTGITKDGGKEEVGMELYKTESSLPDCSHACGPCIPCKRVIVSFKCSVSESCPIVYRCMCKGKFYHVPSN